MSRRPADLVRLASWVGTALTALTLVGIAGFLLVATLPVLRHEGMGFVSGRYWGYRQALFGAASMLYGTAWVAGIALVLAAPLGLATALFLSEVCPPRLRLPCRMLVELLAGVPSVVYGLLGVLFLRNWMGRLYETLELDALSGDSLLTAGVLLAVMILPTVTSLADDGFQAVPAVARLQARGLGLNRFETVAKVVLPGAAPALFGAVLLALGRALGETIAVFLVVGRADNRLPTEWLTLRPLVEAGQTLTSKLGGAETHIAVGDPLHMAALSGLGLMLLAVVLGLTLLGDWSRGRGTVGLASGRVASEGGGR